MLSSRIKVIVLCILMVFAILAFAANYDELSGSHNIIIKVFESAKGGKILWTRTVNNVEFSDGNLPFDPAELVKEQDFDKTIVFMEISIDGSALESGRIAVSMPSSLMRGHSPEESSEITDEMEDELQIGAVGQELYIASDVTGFGDDAPNERITVDGVVSLSHDAAPIASHGFGKIYVDETSGHLIFMDDAGTTTDLVVDGNAVQSVSSSANHTGRMSHMRFIPGEATEITESATDDTIYIRYDVNVTSSGSGPDPCTSAPPTPNPIDGPSLVCTGEPGTSYSVPPTEGATYYRWVLPTGSHILSGSGTNAIHAILGSTDGNITVTAWNACGESGPRNKAITINRPTLPGPISGPALVCRNQTGVSYSISTVPDATNYNWTVPPGASIISGSSTPTIVINYGTSPGEVCVRTENSCGISEPQCLTVSMTWTPGTPGSITGPSEVCAGDASITYSIASVEEATTYNWSLPTGASISSGSGTTTIDVNFATASGDVCVSAENSCGTSSERCLAVTVQEAPSITSHPSNTTVGEGDPASFSITASGDALTYQWEQNIGSGFATIPGATTSSYSISTTTAGMDGYQYRCIVDNSTCSSVTSNIATLSIETSLYPFTLHTFTNSSATGKTGPSLAQCRSAYSTTWDDTYLGMSTNGIQEWTVPADGNYRITAAGAQGGCGSTGGGDGAIMQGTFTLARGDILQILVGQEGLCSSDRGSGGGGSFVADSDDNPLIVAGGGAGGGGDHEENTDAVTGVNALDNSTGRTCGGGEGGNNGGGGGAGANYGGPGGGGFYTDGGDLGYSAYDQYGGVGGTQTTPGGNGGGSVCNGTGGNSFLNGGVGGERIGTCYSSSPDRAGGFGGGGANYGGNQNGGGGGGYSGGAGGCYSDGPCTSIHYGGQTGGASYNSGTSQSNSVGNTGHGYVTIEKL